MKGTAIDVNGNGTVALLAQCGSNSRFASKQFKEDGAFKVQSTPSLFLEEPFQPDFDFLFRSGVLFAGASTAGTGLGSARSLAGP